MGDFLLEPTTELKILSKQKFQKVKNRIGGRTQNPSITILFVFPPGVPSMFRIIFFI